MSQNNIAPSLFDDGQIGGGSLPQQSKITQATNLVDLLHDGFYIVFLLKNQYVPEMQTALKTKF